MTNPMGLDEMRRILKRDRTEPFGGDEALRQKIREIVVRFYCEMDIPVETELDKQAYAHFVANVVVKTGITYTELGLSGYMGILPDVLILEHLSIEKTRSQAEARRMKGIERAKKWDRD